jgi:hypothetical protein
LSTVIVIEFRLSNQPLADVQRRVWPVSDAADEQGQGYARVLAEGGFWTDGAQGVVWFVPPRQIVSVRVGPRDVLDPPPRGKPGPKPKGGR